MIEKLIESEAVRKFFPEDLADIVGYKETEIKYTGIIITKNIGCNSLHEQLYLAAMISNSYLQQIEEQLDFAESGNFWICQEGLLYKKMANRFGESMYGNSPLLVLRITNWTQPRSDHFRFAELLRYADHEQFRKKGLATAVLNSVSNQLRSSLGTDFVYVNFPWYGWPKASKVVPVEYSSETLRRDIMKCFVRGDFRHFEEPFFYQRDSSGFFRLTDPTLNQSEHEAAMEGYNFMHNINKRTKH